MRKTALTLAIGLFGVALFAIAMASPAMAARCRNTGSFETWLTQFKKDALAQGISPQVLAAAAPDLVFDPGIIRRDHGQAVFQQTFLQFSDRMVGGARIPNGQEKMKKHAALFAEIEKKYGVPAPVLTAFWGLESDFGAQLRQFQNPAARWRRSPMTAAAPTSSASNCSTRCASCSAATSAWRTWSATGPANSAACSSPPPTISRTRSTSTATAAAT